MDRIILGDTTPYQWFDVKLLVPKNWRAHYTREEIEEQNLHTQHFYAGQYEKIPFLMLIHQAGNFENLVRDPYIYDYISVAMEMIADAKIEAVSATMVGGHDAFYYALSGGDEGSQILFQQTVFVDGAGDLYSIALAGDIFCQEDLETIVGSITVNR